MSSRVVSLSVAMFTAAEIAAAQVIPIQTVPLVPADQFDIFPSLGLAMGGVSIALADTLHDPFVNPATGARLRTAHLLGSPTFYGVSDDAGAGRTLPLALFTAARTWFGGLALAVQQLDAGRRTTMAVTLRVKRCRIVRYQPRALWRMRLAVIIAAHSSTDVSGAHAVTGAVMTSAILVASASRCAGERHVTATRSSSVITIVIPNALRCDWKGKGRWEAGEG